MTRRLYLAAALALAMLLTADARAGSVSTTFNASASVSGNCTVTATGALAFGAYDPLTANSVTAKAGSGASLSVLCTRGSHPIVAMGNGSHFGTATFDNTRRAMTIGAAANQQLAYDLLQPSANGAAAVASAANWGAGAGTPGTSYDAGVTTVSPTTATVLNIFGSIPGGQDVVASATAYSDTVSATVNF